MRLLIVTLTVIATGALHAQGTPPVAVLDTSTILIGDQARLDLSISYRVDDGAPVNIIWPVIADTLSGKIEIIADSGVDTALVDPEADPFHFTQHRTLTITSFDSGYWAIPPFRFVVDGDTATAPLLLTVNTVQVDTTQAYRDIKEIYELPFSWRYWLRQNWPYMAGGAAVLAALLLVVREVRRRRRLPKAVEVKQPPQPLHVRTLLALEEVDKRKLWQQGLAKQHHSEVTDILRGYIEERFGVPALERTTDELMVHLKLSPMDGAHREQLRNLLQLADMVKFAKWNPSPTENEQVLAGAIRIVQDTSMAEHKPTAHGT